MRPGDAGKGLAMFKAFARARIDQFLKDAATQSEAMAAALSAEVFGASPGGMGSDGS